MGVSLKKDEFGSRMKLYEGMEAQRTLMPLLPVCARIDGKAFHSFCRGLERPYDKRLSKLMEGTALFLLEKTNALVAYTQSDEINLVWYSNDIKSQIFMNGRVAKMISILAGWASAYFCRHLPEVIPEKAHKLETFDCRVWNVPNKVEAANVILWREQDATRNSIAMAAQSVYSHTQLHKKSRRDMLDMLHEKDINWNDYPAFFKRGSFIQKHRVCRPYSAEELEKLPAKHQARQNPDLIVERWNIRQSEMPPFGRVTNRVGVIFEGEKPQVASYSELAEEARRNGMVPEDIWDEKVPEEPLIIARREIQAGVPTGIAWHPTAGWLVLQSNPGPYILWMKE